MITFDHVMEIALLILGSYLGGCVLGYGAHLLVRRSIRRTEQALAPTPAIRAAPPSAARRLAQASAREDAAVVTNADMQRPLQLPGPRNGRPDDLQKIKGIGPKTVVALNDLGIYHFDQIAAWHRVHVDWLDGRVATKKRIQREQWVEQAALLATEAPLRRTG